MFPYNINMMSNPMQMEQSFGVMGGINPMIGNRQIGMGINPQMCMGQIPLNPMCVHPGMMPFMMGMTQEQKNQYLRYQGYLYGKFLAQQKKLANANKNSNHAPVIIDGPATGILNIKFNKRGNIINISLDANEMVAVL